MKKNKKFFIVTLIIIVISILLYFGIWYYYYSAIYLKHLPDNFSEFTHDGMNNSSFDRYISPPDEGYNTYFITKPKIGHFVCTIGGSSAIGTDDDRYIIDEYGEKIPEYYNMSGSEFDYTFASRFNLKGEVDTYTFNVVPMKPNSEYANTAYLELDLEGNLINEKEISATEYAIYRDAHTELIEFINILNTMFKVN